MWSEDFDKKAQDAARDHSPAYDDKNWDRMESLLNKHLPVEKKKRRFIFWFILPIAVGISAYFLIHTSTNSTNNTNSNNNSTNAKNGTSNLKDNNSVASSTISSAATDNDPATRLSSDQKEKDNTSAIAEENVVSSGVINQPAAGNPPAAGNNLIAKSKNKPSGESLAIAGRNQKSNPAVETFNDNVAATEKDDKDKNLNAAVPLTGSIAAAAPPDDKKPTETIPAATSKDNTPAADSAIASESPAAVTKKPKKSNNKGFIAGISLGPDVSGLGMNKAGNVQMQYGLTVGYAFSDRFTLRTGFFAGHKIYTADPSEYHPPYNFWQYYPKVEKIDANCLVYEIPITAVYNFPSSKKHNWFVSGGVSSYLMKDETYDYYYKNTWGQTEMKSRTISNENSHLFSIINLSGGYKRNLSKNIFLMAEPYLKLPVSGVGYGKVKLNSGGVLFTVGARL